MQRLTLGDARPTISRVTQSQFPPESDAVRDRINEAQQRLIFRGKWPGLEARYAFCTYEGCIVLPRELDAVLGFDVDKTPRQINSGWYEFLETGPGITGRMGWSDAIDRGSTVTFNSICTPSLIRVYSDALEATGSQILIKGFNQYGNRVMTYDVNGNLIDGEYVSLVNASPNVTVNTFKSIDSVVKPYTKGPVRLYAWDGASTQTSLAVYQPSEINPTYRWYSVPGLQPNPDTASIKPKTITVYAKRRFIPAILDTDDLMITNIAALKNMVMAIEYEERNEGEKSDYYEKRAISNLNSELKEYMGGAQTRPSFTLHGYFAGDMIAGR